MKKPKAISNYQSMSTPMFIEFVDNAVDRMSNNQLFQNPDISYDQIRESNRVLKLKFQSSQFGGKQQTAELNQARKDLHAKTHILALYVDRMANGDEAIIHSSGFLLAKQPTPSPRLLFEASNGNNEGEIVVKHRAILDAKSYIWQYCAHPIEENQWVQAAITTKSNYTITGLTSIAKYWFRAAYISAEGQSDWSDPVSEVVK